MYWRSRLGLLFVLMCLLCGGGCASTAVIAAAGVTAGFGLAQGQAEAFINGELKAARMVSLESAEEATLATFEELQVSVKVHRRGATDRYIMAKAPDGPEFRVTISAKSPVVTKFEIRIGMMGDQAVARLAMARIDVKLGIEQTMAPVEVSPVVAPPPPPPPPATQPQERSDTPPATQPAPMP